MIGRSDVHLNDDGRIDRFTVSLALALCHERRGIVRKIESDITWLQVFFLLKFDVHFTNNFSFISNFLNRPTIYSQICQSLEDFFLIFENNLFFKINIFQSVYI